MSLWAAAVQLRSTDDVADNLDRSCALVKRAAEAGAKLVALPENFAYLGPDSDHKVALAEEMSRDASGPILTTMRQLARTSGVWLLLGGLPERTETAGRIANSSVLLDPQGSLRARYRKMHLFDVDVPGGQRFRESELVEPGQEVVVADTPWGGLGLSICYDLRFPELYRALTRAGANLLAVPSAFTRETGKDHWHVLLRARAIENQSFVIAPAQWGFHGGQRASYGHALLVDPWGVVLAECGDRDGFALAPLDLEQQAAIRRDLPCLHHRRL